ncbi:MAG: hypothetical protein D6677_01795 [Calditrichaeota bacterium]|nr:MAG: hypothetical protein D6677_01795 [Calditrichota bacterium]
MRVTNFKSQRGNMATTVVVVVLILATLGVILASLSSADSALQLLQQEDQRAFYAAQSGLEYGVKRYLSSDDVEEFNTTDLDLGDGVLADVSLEDNGSEVIITAVGKSNKSQKTVQTIISAADSNYVPDYAVFTTNTVNGVKTTTQDSDDDDPSLVYQNAPTLPRFDLDNLKELAQATQDDGQSYYYAGDLTVDEDFDPPANTIVYAEGNITFNKGNWDGPVFFVAGGDAVFSDSWKNTDHDIQMLLYVPGSLQKIRVEPAVADDDPVEFEVDDGEVIPKEEYAASVTVIGGDLPFAFWIIYPIFYIPYDAPITIKVNVGDQAYHPFGPNPGNGNAAAKWKVNLGNVNDDNNPRTYVFPETYDADTPISVEASSWSLLGFHARAYRRHMRVNSSVDLDYVYALRDGDPVPDVAPFGDQKSAAEFVQDYVNFNSQTMSLESNQVIYLFELADASLSTPSADFQDVVVMVNLARERSDLADGDDDDDDHDEDHDDDDDEDEEDNSTIVNNLAFKGGIISEGKIYGSKTVDINDKTYTNRLKVTRDEDIIKSFLSHSVNGNARIILASKWKAIK